MMLETMVSPTAAAALIASSDDAIIGLTLDGIVTSWNAGASRVYGYEAGDIVGYRLHQIIPHELRDAEMGRVERAARGEGVRTMDAPRARRDGTRLVVSSSFFPIRDDRYRITAVGVIERDVTQQRALEAQLLQAKRMETVGRLAGGVAQEFNNVTTAILGLADFLAPHVEANGEATADVNAIAEQARRASRLAQHLLAFSDRDTTVPGPVYVNASLRSMEPLLQRLVGERVWLTLDLEATDMLTRAAASDLELVLFEIITRAADALQDHGTMTISTRRVTVDDSTFPTPAGVPSGDYMEVEVRCARHGANDAPSLRLSEKSAAFDAFGMAMIYSVVGRFGGYAVTSGSIIDEIGPDDISIYIPVVPDGAARAADHSLAGDLSGDETILLVEDEVGVREVVARGLRSRGYHVLEAQHGADALDVAEAYAGPIDLVVSDVVMPHMDGRALFERLRGWYPGIRFLFVSGYTRGAIHAEQLRGPVTDFLAKPFTLDELCAASRALIDRERAPAEAV